MCGENDQAIAREKNNHFLETVRQKAGEQHGANIGSARRDIRKKKREICTRSCASHFLALKKESRRLSLLMSQHAVLEYDRALKESCEAFARNPFFLAQEGK